MLGSVDPDLILTTRLQIQLVFMVEGRRLSLLTSCNFSDHSKNHSSRERNPSLGWITQTLCSSCVHEMYLSCVFLCFCVPCFTNHGYVLQTVHQTLNLTLVHRLNCHSAQEADKPKRKGKLSHRRMGVVQQCLLKDSPLGTQVELALGKKRKFQ